MLKRPIARRIWDPLPRAVWAVTGYEENATPAPSGGLTLTTPSGNALTTPAGTEINTPG